MKKINCIICDSTKKTVIAKQAFNDSYLSLFV